jgi:hypothetical protein
MPLYALRAGWENGYEKEANPERNSKRQQIYVHVHNLSTGLGRRTLVFRPPRLSGGQVTVESCGRGTYSEGSPQSNRLWSPGPRGLRQEIAAGIWFLAQRIIRTPFAGRHTACTFLPLQGALPVLQIHFVRRSPASGAGRSDCQTLQFFRNGSTPGAGGLSVF